MMKWEVWEVDTHPYHSYEKLLADCYSWWAAHRLVRGIVGEHMAEPLDHNSNYEKEFTVQWYKVDLEVRKAEE